MDPLGTTASIIAVIQLSSTVVQCISTATGATRDRRRLRSEVQACDDILQQLRDESDESEESKTWSDTIKALEAPGSPLGLLKAALTIVQDKLQPKDGYHKAVAVLKWPFQEKEAEKIIGAVTREKRLLELALSNEHRKLTQEIKRSARESGKQLKELFELVEESSKEHRSQLTDIKEGVQRLDTQQGAREADREWQTILDWLTPFDHASQQSDLRSKRNWPLVTRLR